MTAQVLRQLPKQRKLILALENKGLAELIGLKYAEINFSALVTISDTIYMMYKRNASLLAQFLASMPIHTAIQLDSANTSGIAKMVSAAIREYRVAVSREGVAAVYVNGRAVQLNGDVDQAALKNMLLKNLNDSAKEAETPTASSFLTKAASVGLAVAGLFELAQSVYAPPPRPEDVASLAMSAGLNCFIALTMFDGNPLGGVALLGCTEGIAATIISFAKLLAENKQYIAISPSSAKKYYMEAVRMIQNGYGLSDKYGYYMYSGLVTPVDAATSSLLTMYGYRGAVERLKGVKSDQELFAMLPASPVRLPTDVENWLNAHSGLQSTVKILGGEETTRELIKDLGRYRIDPTPGLENQLLSKIKFVSTVPPLDVPLASILGGFAALGTNLQAAKVFGSPTEPIGSKEASISAALSPARAVVEALGKGLPIPFQQIANMNVPTDHYSALISKGLSPQPKEYSDSGADIRQRIPHQMPTSRIVPEDIHNTAVSGLQAVQPQIYAIESFVGLGLVARLLNRIKSVEGRMSSLESSVQQLQKAQQSAVTLSAIREELLTEYADDVPECCGKDIQTGKRPISVPKGIKLPAWAIPKMGIKTPSLPFLGAMTAGGAIIAMIVRMLEKIETGR